MVAGIGDYPMIYCDSELCGEDLQPLGQKDLGSRPLSVLR
jgi:hypothetical protein